MTADRAALLVIGLALAVLAVWLFARAIRLVLAERRKRSSDEVNG